MSNTGSKLISRYITAIHWFIPTEAQQRQSHREKGEQHTGAQQEAAGVRARVGQYRPGQDHHQGIEASVGTVRLSPFPTDREGGGKERTADADLRTMLSQARRSPKVAGALLFSCNGRGTNLFPAPDHDISVIHEVLEKLPDGIVCSLAVVIDWRLDRIVSVQTSAERRQHMGAAEHQREIEGGAGRSACALVPLL